MKLNLKGFLFIVLGACSSQNTTFNKGSFRNGILIIKNSQTSRIRGIRLQEIESRYQGAGEKTHLLEKFLLEAEKSGALYVSHIRVTDFGEQETCIIFLGPEEELKTELLTQLNASDPAQTTLTKRPRQFRTEYLSEHYSNWKLAESKALCQPADKTRVSGFTLIQARVYMADEKLNPATD